MRISSSEVKAKERVGIKPGKAFNWFMVSGFYLACLLAVVILSGYLVSVKAINAYNPDNLIRLHVIGNSETYEDQVLKYHIRDVVLKGLAKDLAGVSSEEEAARLLLARIPEIQETCTSEVRKYGKAYGVRVDLVDAHAPGRSYGVLDLPEGRYRTMRVVLGRGNGSNWWCVLFPPFCFVDIATSGGLSGTIGGVTAADLTDAYEVTYGIVTRPTTEEVRAEESLGPGESVLGGNRGYIGKNAEPTVVGNTEPIILLNSREIPVRTEIRFAILDAFAKFFPKKAEVAKMKPDDSSQRP
ncbi:MAG TPA: stage II sporulation protein R [Clostridia bacterium]|nr:stage II sporulation protein R [Clostridia bacterium]